MITSLSTQTRRYPQLRSTSFGSVARLSQAAMTSSPITLVKYVDVITGQILLLLPLS